MADDRWTPALRLQESGGRCRLLLAGVAYGQGETLQDAAADLVARIELLAAAVRRSGLRVPAELGPPDPRILAFLYELGELAAHGGDIRERIFGMAA